MKEMLQITMTEQALFDFLLFHAYSKCSGFLTNVLGLAVGIMGIIQFIMDKISVVSLCFYIIASVIFILSVPLQLRYRAKKLLRSRKEYQGSFLLIFDDTGIKRVKDGQPEQKFQWEQLERVVATPKTIGFYYGKEQAWIVPKESFGQQYFPVMKLTAAHVSQNRIRLR